MNINFPKPPFRLNRFIWIKLNYLNPATEFLINLIIWIRSIFWTKIKFSAESKRLEGACSCVFRLEANSIDKNLPIWYTFCGHFTQMRFFNFFFHPVLGILLVINNDLTPDDLWQGIIGRHTDIEMHNLIKLDMVVLKPDYAFSGWSWCNWWKRIPKLVPN